MLPYFSNIKITLVISLFLVQISYAQLPEECQLDIGTNMAGLADFGTEIPFVDLMKTCRTWYTKDIGNPNAPFDSEQAQHLSYRSDGYPTHVPQTISESIYPQKVVTIWAITDGWTPGQYTILWEGTGTFEFVGTHQNLTQTDPHRITFDFPNPINGLFELTIATSDIADPIHNIRILMPGTESTYISQPFNPVWLTHLLKFKTIRFMDWGQTNNWGQTESGWNDPSLFDWSERSQMNHYTWAYEKGVPYEMMVRLMNDYDLDGWVCVPHRASNDYLSEMANFFRDSLEMDRHLTVEYSNEIWNWIFGQTQWLNEYGCIQTGIPWPNGIVPYVQNCLDHFTTAYAGQTNRITRAVGAFTGWPAITDTIVSNLTPGSFDAIAPTFYFGLTEAADMALDALGSNATAADVAFYARQGMAESMMYIRTHKTDMADPLGIPLTFYEGGQHLTPHPFGVEPSYAQALLDVQRDSAMFNLYNEWFDSLRTLQVGSDPLQLSHFSFVSHRSAQYGSWGMLESMNQDTSMIPAPKFTAILNNMAPEICNAPLSVEWEDYTLEQINCTAHIFWSTTSENNNSHFVIEKSVDGNSFREIAIVDGKGNSNELVQYHFAEDLSRSGTFYYRIQQIDFDGTSSIIGVRAIEMKCHQFDFEIFPNPVTNELKIVFSHDLNTKKYVIVNLNGQVILEKNIYKVLAGDELKINVQHLPKGVYYLKLIGDYFDGLGKRFVKI